MAKEMREQQPGWLQLFETGKSAPQSQPSQELSIAQRLQT